MATVPQKTRFINDRSVLNTFYTFGTPLGNIYYVNSTHASASASGPGTSPECPFSTIDAAVGACTANNDDYIIVAPGHVETISAAGGLAIDVAGITILGQGRGAKQAKLDFTAAASTCTMSANDCVLHNFQVEASFADIVSQIVVTGLNCKISNCRFLEPTTDENALINILTGATTTGSGLVVEGCEFLGLDTANTHGISMPGTPSGVRIRDNLFLGVFETGAIGAAGAVVQIAVTNNLINNTSADADECIVLASSSTGVVAYNGVGNNLAGNATTNISCGTTCTLIQNYSTDKGDVQGVLDPVAT